VVRVAILALLLSSCQRVQERAPEPPSCIDAQLAARGLNSFGDPRDTVYAGGTPLFDEKTGKSRDRRDYIRERHPEIAAACAPDR
jgi:hypothetical protein